MPAGEGDGVHGSLEGALSAWRSVREDIVTCPPLLLNVWRCQGPYRRPEHAHHGGYRSVTSAARQQAPAAGVVVDTGDRGWCAGLGSAAADYAVFALPRVAPPRPRRTTPDSLSIRCT